MPDKSTNKEKLTEIWAEVKAYLEEALPEVTRLMEEKFASLHGKPEPGGALDQIGLRNGAKVVSDYMVQNELGVALEHLCYMVDEANLPLSITAYTHIKAAEEIMQIDIPALRRIAPPSK